MTTSETPFLAITATTINTDVPVTGSSNPFVDAKTVKEQDLNNETEAVAILRPSSTVPSAHPSSVQQQLPQPQQQQQQRPPRVHSPENQILSTNINMTGSLPLHQLVNNVNISPQEKEKMAKLDLLRRVTEDLYYIRASNMDLAERERNLQERMNIRKKEQQLLLDNYDEHIRSRRATGDNEKSIRKKLKELKLRIKHFSSMVVENENYSGVDTKIVAALWQGKIKEHILELGSPLPKHRIKMIIEKFVMDMLIDHRQFDVLESSSISYPYTTLQNWFAIYDRSFRVRFRQEIAKVIVDGNIPNSEINAEILEMNEDVCSAIYTSITPVFPFIKKHDQILDKKDPSRFYSILTEVVALASNIGYAIQGQESEIVAFDIKEGSELFTPLSMVEEDAQTSGVVHLCIFPPFGVRNKGITTTLEKGQVLCLSIPDTNS